MGFASPFWLLVLLPWGALALWLLMGQRRDVGVPFLELWQGPVARPSRSRSLRKPPVYLVMMLLAAAFAIVGASGPKLYTRATGLNAPLRVLVDTGLSLPLAQRTRLAEEVGHAVLNEFGEGPAVLQAIPERSQAELQRKDLAPAIIAIVPTAVDTLASIAAAAALAEQEAQPTLLLTGHNISSNNGNLIIVAPDQALKNISVTALATNDSGSPQVMVSILNQSPLNNAPLTIRVGDSQPQQHQLELPSTGQSRNYFFDLPELSNVISCVIDVDDDIKADNCRWLVRESAWPEIEPRGTLRPELARMIEVYSKLRPSSRRSATVTLTADESLLSRDTPAAIIARGNSEGTIDPASLRVIDHPVAVNVKWDRAKPVQSNALPSGWTPIVQHGSATLVAAQENPRRIWVALDQSAWSREADFVIFWTNSFNWLGEGASTYASHLPRALGPEWKALEPENRPAGTPAGLWPGLYERNDGEHLAIHASADEFPMMPQVTDWKSQLKQLAKRRRAFVDLTPSVLLLSLVASLFAATTWPSSRKPSPHRIGEQVVSG